MKLFIARRLGLNNLLRGMGAAILFAATLPIQINTLIAGNVCNSGRVGVAPTYYTGASPRSVAMGDFSGDGMLDLAVANYDDSHTSPGNVSILTGIGDGRFEYRLYYINGKQPIAVVAGDFNRDGKLDLAVANQLSNDITIFLGNGNGTLQQPLSYTVGTGPSSLAIGDFQGDGKIDLVVASNDSSTLSVLLGNGNGTFQPALIYSIGPGPRFVAVGDFNGDGKPDLAVAHSIEGYFGFHEVSIFLGKGDGSFGSAVTYSAAENPMSIAMGDFNGDGRVDLAVGSQSTNEISILIGNGDGSFKAPRNYAAGGSPASIAIADFNADGKLDMAVANSTYTTFGTHNVSVLLGNGDGSFQSATNYEAGENPAAVAAGDVNGDGRVDLVVSNYSGASVSVLMGNNDGTFQASLNYAAGPTPYWIAAGDFNGDGRPDLAVTNYTSDTASILLAAGHGGFKPPTSYKVGSYPQAVVAADFNSDGKLDLAVANRSSNTFSILSGNGDGTFQPAVNYDTGPGSSPQFIAIGDFNHDGKPDLAVASAVGGEVLILFGKGDGSFRSPVHVSLTIPAEGVSVADFNRDGVEDLVTLNENSHSVSILLGRGDGTFQPGRAFGVGRYPKAVTVGDFNGDGYPDLAVTSPNVKGTESILLGKGDGTFQSPVDYEVVAYPQFSVVGDLNGDGKSDIFVVSLLGRESVMFGNGDGTFKPAIPYLIGSSPQSAVIADFNGDGMMDVALANAFSADVSVVMNGTSLTLVPASLPDGVFGQAYNQSLMGTGGVPPYHFEISGGALPMGLSLSTFGQISGTPLALGPFSLSVTVTDALGCTQRQGVIMRTVAANHISLAIPAGGAFSASTVGSVGIVQTGFAVLEQTSSLGLVFGTAVVSVVQNGVVISEVGVPSVSETRSARTLIEYRQDVSVSDGHPEAGPIAVNTGLAIANRGYFTATVTYQLRDSKGNTIAIGHGSILPLLHRAFFIDQLEGFASDFVLPPDFSTQTGFASLEISSDQPLALLTLRATTNQRGETLLTTMPTADLTQSLPPRPLVFPHFVDGGGYTTSLFMLNTSDSPETGKLFIYDETGAPLTVHRMGDPAGASSSYNYEIPPGGFYILKTDGSPGSVRAGAVHVMHDPTGALPACAGLFSYSSGAVLVTESGIPSTTIYTSGPTSNARIYVDQSNGHKTGLALANYFSQPVHVTLNAFQSDGVTPVGTASLDLGRNSHAAKFVDELIPSLPDGFTGVLNISASPPVAALTLRSFTNSRGDTLLTTFPVGDDDDLTLSYPLIFPQIADGGGYRTQIILLARGGGFTATLKFYDDNGLPLGVGKNGRDRNGAF